MVVGLGSAKMPQFSMPRMTPPLLRISVPMLLARLKGGGLEQRDVSHEGRGHFRTGRRHLLPHLAGHERPAHLGTSASAGEAAAGGGGEDVRRRRARRASRQQHPRRRARRFAWSRGMGRRWLRTGRAGVGENWSPSGRWPGRGFAAKRHGHGGRLSDIFMHTNQQIRRQRTPQPRTGCVRRTGAPV